ncbi:putative peptidase M23B [Leptolyngbya sp. NIES-3755]|nr:putative peptidase M23B [Leptolyngbya sp. NIES-3755]
MTQPLLNATFALRVLLLSGLGSLIGFSEISRAQTPAAIDSIPQTPAAKITIPAGGDAFIDRTDYSLGATERIEPEKAIAKPVPAAPKSYAASDPVSVAPVEVAGFSLSSSGISWNTTAPANPIGSTYGTVQNYYNRTVRPIGRIGNGDLKLIFPLAIPAPITSMFGWRLHPISGDARLHTGTDIGAPLGTPVLAALTGRVIMADFFGGYGLSVALEHNAGAQQTLYAHLSELFVKPGEIVKQGSVIGRVGSTGNSTGPHLHFEVRQQTTEGWVAMDAGVVLETAMAELVKSMQVAQAPKTR